MVDGIQKGFGPAADIQLFKNAVYMRLDGLFTDEKVLGDFFVGAAGDQVMENFDLPGCEAFFGSFRSSFQMGIIISQSLEELRHHSPFDP